MKTKIILTSLALFLGLKAYSQNNPTSKLNELNNVVGQIVIGTGKQVLPNQYQFNSKYREDDLVKRISYIVIDVDTNGLFDTSKDYLQLTVLKSTESSKSIRGFNYVNNATQGFPYCFWEGEKDNSVPRYKSQYISKLVIPELEKFSKEYTEEK